MEVTTRVSSISTPFRGEDSEPVAMTIAFASIVCASPFSGVTVTLPGAAIEPVPMNVSILFFLKRYATPLTLACTTESLWACIAGRSSFGVPTLMPNVSKRWPARSNISEVCSSAFDGMQPTFRQVPPKVGLFSMTATLRPSWAALMAQT